MSKKKEEKHIEHTLKIDGYEIKFLFTKTKDGRLYYRPTKEQLLKNPRLKPLKKKNLSEILNEILKLYSVNNPEDISKKFFSDEIVKYMRETKKYGSNPNKPSTYANVEFILSHYIIPYFDGLLIKDVDDRVCRNMITSLKNHGYSKSIIDKAYFYTNDFLKYLTAKQIISYNPMILVSKPTPEKIEEAREKAGKKQKTRHYLEKNEIEKIRDVIYNGYDIVQPAINTETLKRKEYIQHKKFEQPEVYDFLLNSGLRTGELLALKFEDWDPDEGTINISKARVSYIERNETGKGKYISKEMNPKNKASKTKLKLTSRANEILKIMIAKEPDGYKGYIVHDRNHNPINVRAFEGRLDRILEHADLKDENGNKIRISPHDFRHTFASALWEECKDMVYVKEKLRHKDITTTEKIYVDLRKEYEAELDKKIVV